jgi:hypothetical protein
LKKNELLEYINKLKIVVPKMSYSKLYAEAVEHYNFLWSLRGHDYKFATISADKSFLNRIALNMLRH